MLTTCPFAQVALQLNGYYCTEDECRWWQFGDATDSALRAFQVRAPASGEYLFMDTVL